MNRFLEPLMANRPRRPPLRTFIEIAADLGLTTSQLRGELAHSLVKPAPAMRQASASTKNTWYEPKAMREWWAARQLEKTK